MFSYFYVINYLCKYRQGKLQSNIQQIQDMLQADEDFYLKSPKTKWQN